MKITVLGCGGSGGVPAADGAWGNCNPSNPKNRRLRPSIAVDGDCGTRLIVDTGPDFREQMLNLGWNGRLDGVLYTHHHADHIYGMDDLRRFANVLNRPIDIYAHDISMSYLRLCFHHVFNGGHTEFYPKMVEPHGIEDEMQFGSITVQPFKQSHGEGMYSTGFRFGDLAYSTDIWDVPEDTWPILEGIKVWILDMANDGNPVHADRAKVIKWAEKLGVEQVFLTHLSPRMDYNTLCKELPEHIRPAYDGQVIEL